MMVSSAPVARATSALPRATVPITLYPQILAICAAHWVVPPPVAWISIHSPSWMRPACALVTR